MKLDQLQKTVTPLVCRCGWKTCIYRTISGFKDKRRNENLLHQINTFYTCVLGRIKVVFEQLVPASVYF